jgi:hypothetical protein
MHLSGESSCRRAHFENMVLNDLVAWRAGQSPRTRIMHWRTTVGADVSFVIQFADESVLGIQISEGAELTASELTSINLFLSEYGEAARGGIVLHGGSEIRLLQDRLVAAPWSAVL